MILYIADLHFGHKNVIHLDHRPFDTVDEMDEYLIMRWNDRVQADDDVYVVGDFCYKSPVAPQDYLKRLTGKKHLIIGNHDTKLLKNSIAMKYFETVSDVKLIDDNGRQVLLCHYPFAEWNGYFRNVYHVYGHIHNNDNVANRFMKTIPNAFNAGCMVNGYAPCSLRELIDHHDQLRR